MIYLQLFWSFFQIGLFAVGGGYAALPLIQSQVVAQNAWLTLSEFTVIVTISQITPGPIAINAATFVGIRIAGVGGALFADAFEILNLGIKIDSHTGRPLSSRFIPASPDAAGPERPHRSSRNYPGTPAAAPPPESCRTSPSPDRWPGF